MSFRFCFKSEVSFNFGLVKGSRTVHCTRPLTGQRGNGGASGVAAAGLCREGRVMNVLLGFIRQIEASRLIHFTRTFNVDKAGCRLR